MKLRAFVWVCLLGSAVLLQPLPAQPDETLAARLEQEIDVLERLCAGRERIVSQRHGDLLRAAVTVQAAGQFAQGLPSLEVALYRLKDRFGACELPFYFRSREEYRLHVQSVRRTTDGSGDPGRQITQLRINVLVAELVDRVVTEISRRGGYRFGPYRGSVVTRLCRPPGLRKENGVNDARYLRFVLGFYLRHCTEGDRAERLARTNLDQLGWEEASQVENMIFAVISAGEILAGDPALDQLFATILTRFGSVEVPIMMAGDAQLERALRPGSTLYTPLREIVAEAMRQIEAREGFRFLLVKP